MRCFKQVLVIPYSASGGTGSAPNLGLQDQIRSKASGGTGAAPNLGLQDQIHSFGMTEGFYPTIPQRAAFFWPSPKTGHLDTSLAALIHCEMLRSIYKDN